MKVIRFLLRAFGIVQWFTAIAIGVGCIIFQVLALEEFDDMGSVGSGLAGDTGNIDGLSDILSNLGLLVVSMNVTLPGLLLSILLMLSAIYCDRAAARSTRAKPSSVE